ncbi:MAG: hypothetical protein V7701_10835 [Sneathiella sp.]
MKKTILVRLQLLMLILFCSMVSLTISPNTSFAMEWVKIKKEQSDILFYPPGGHSSIIHREQENIKGKFFHTVWYNAAGFYPRGEVVLFDLIGRFFPYEADLEEATRSWKYTKEKSLIFEEPQSIHNGFGKTLYQVFGLEDQSCVGFLRYFGAAVSDNAGTSPGTKQLRGYYCFDTKGQLSESQILTLLNAVSVRGEKAPIKP